MADPVTTASGPSGWATGAMMLTAASGFLLGLLAHVRERRRDKAKATTDSQGTNVAGAQVIFDGYGKFVEGLQHDLARVREELEQISARLHDCEEGRAALIARVSELEARLG